MSGVNSFSAFDFNQNNDTPDGSLCGGEYDSSRSGIGGFSGTNSCSHVGDVKYITLPFFYNGKPASETFGDAAVPSCVMSLASAGSLRYNSGLENPPRKKFLNEVLPRGVMPVPVYLVHSKTVFVAEPDADSCSCGARGVNYGDVRLWEPESCTTFRSGAEGDGIITSCRSFAPCVTAADCMPVFLWDSKTGAFGICHSGWKGTGIAAKAVALMGKTFGSVPADICVILGPHIHKCCYTVDAERAAYFRRDFSSDCCTPVDAADVHGAASGVSSISASAGGVKPASSGSAAYGNQSALKPGGIFRLSLARANEVSLEKSGIKPENILHCTDCTSCFSLPVAPGAANAIDGRCFPYGSFRRQTAHLPEGTPLEERFKVFSAMLALIGYIAHK